MRESTWCWRRVLLLLIGIVITACGDPVEDTPDNPMSDVGVDFGLGIDTEPQSTATDIGVEPVSEDAQPATPNLCGGVRELVYQGLPGEPSAECGPCGDGVLICDGPNAIRCWGASQLNGCGTCEVLAAEPGEACGVCLDGEYACEPDGSVICSGANEINACGGCAKLEGDPGFVCEDEGGAGVTLCRSETELVCVGDDENACGGAGALAPLPTQPCGDCNGGVTACDGEDATQCTDGQRWLNTCGGCAPLAGEPGDPCGLCGGSYICHPEDFNRVICDDPNRNACGGCELLDGAAGDACGDGEIWHCDGVNAVICGDASLNDCGGAGALDTMPGLACGLCEDGVQICASPEVLVCVDAIQRNVCGGCSLLPGVLGLPCGAAYTWQCSAGDLACLPGEGASVGRVGDSCTELLDCENGLCLIINSEAEQGFCSVLCDVDLDCPEGFECEVLSGDGPDAVNVCFPRSFCIDADADGYGIGPACLGVDCDETETAINQDAIDVCDGSDNNCNGAIDEDNGSCGDPAWIQCVGEGRRASCQEIDGCISDDEGNNYCGVASFWTCSDQSDGPPTCEDVAECLDVGTWLPACDLDWYECAEQDGAPPVCADIDECAVDNGGCDATYFVCRNVEGGPRECLDIDECQPDGLGTNGCGDASQYDCYNQIGADPICDDHDGCEADSGYNDCGFAELWDCVDQEGAPPLCSDRNECLEDNGGCDLVYDECINRTGLTPVCRDLNECLVDNGGCESPRIYECVDNVGAPPTCRDLDDCQVAADGTNACGDAEHWECTNNAAAIATCVGRDACEVVLGGNDCGDIARDWLCEDNVGAAPTCTSCMGIAVSLDGDIDSGCEYVCTSSGSDVCNHRDDDCDGGFDEVTNVDIDTQNCGDCGVVCPVGLDVAAVTCVRGTCVIRECDIGFFDRDLDPSNGCEIELTGRIIWVDAGSGAPGSGTSERPYPTIQRGVEAASIGDLVRVRPGSYSGPITVYTRNIAIEGEDRDTVIVTTSSTAVGFTVLAGGVTLAHMSLSGGREGVRFAGQDGARIADVGAHDLSISQVLNSNLTGSARAVSADFTTRLTASLIEISTVTAGGGTLDVIAGSASGFSVADSDDCIVFGNRVLDLRGGDGADASSGGAGGTGGYAFGANFYQVDHCTFEANEIIGGRGGQGGYGVGPGRGGGWAGRGYGVTFSDSQGATVINNAFSDITGGTGGSASPTSDPTGGGHVIGISISRSGGVEVDGADITRLTGGDTGTNATGGAYGGWARGLELEDSTTVSVSHVAVSRLDGGAGYAPSFCVWAQRVFGATIDNMTCAEIGREIGGGYGVSVQSDQTSTIWLTNSIISGTSSRCLTSSASTPTALTTSNSILWDCGGGLESNTSLGDAVRNVDPLLVDPAASDLRLWPTSPAITSGNGDVAYDLEPSPNGCQRNLGAYGGTGWAVPAPGASDCPPGG